MSQAFTLTPASFEEKYLLRNLMQFYMYDFSEIEGWDVDPQARFEYRYLDHYWTDDKRFPFLLRVKQHLAGFVLVNQHCYSAPEDSGCYSVAEFFILRHYRRQGLGQRLAFDVLDRFGPRWEIRQTPKNHAAQAFWYKVVKAYTQGAFEHYPEGFADYPGVMLRLDKDQLVESV